MPRRKPKAGSAFPDKYPDLVSLWSPANILNPDDYSYGSSTKVWWVCTEGHEWEASIVNVTRKSSRCPYCSGRLPIVGVSDISSTHPDIAKEWCYSKNTRDLSSVMGHSNIKYWWVCEAGHEYKSTPNSRSQGKGCPVCVGKTLVVGINDLRSIKPFLLSEWSPKNNNAPEDYHAHSNKRVWWICTKGHEWMTSIGNRRNASECPGCRSYSTSKIEKIMVKNLAKYFEDASSSWVSLTSGRGYMLDCLISKSFVIEFDGAFWHSDRVTNDLEKTTRLLLDGYSVIRIRESSGAITLDPLPIVNENLLQVPFYIDYRKISDDTFEKSNHKYNNPLD